MLKNQEIICFGFADWDNPYRTNQHHLMERLAKENRVLFIESLGLRQPVFQKKDIIRILKRLKKGIFKLRKVGRNLYVYSPLVLPFHRYSWVRKLNSWILKSDLRKIVRMLKFKRPVLWSYVPLTGDILHLFKVRRVLVYHCVDELTGNPRIPEVISRLERQFLKKCDVVFTSSCPLWLRKKEYNPRAFYLPNVCDFSHFHQTVREETSIPEDIQRIGKPIVGFIGAISGYKLDFDLIKYLALRNKDCNFVFIGSRGEGEKAVSLSDLKSCSNVHFLGRRDYARLPGYLKYFDVCLLPNRINKYTEHMFPLKFFEYLSSGKPVVSTYLKALEEFKDYFYLSRSYEEFNKNLRLALTENEVEKREKRILLARRFSWENRLVEIAEILNMIEDKK